MRLPDFVIVGAQKAGTTAVLATLAQHPDIGAADPQVRNLDRKRRPWQRRRPQEERIVSEPHFFTYRYERGVDWYMSLFTSGAAVVGERTPAILHHPEARQRLRTVLPDAKLIALVRHPVDRAFSHWNHFSQTGGPSRRTEVSYGSFDEAMAADHDWMYTRSLYATHLTALYELFPRSQILVDVAERIRTTPQSRYDRMHDFLGVARRRVDELPAGTANVRSYTTLLEPDVRQKWEHEFADEVERLRTMLDDPIPEWDTPPP